MIKQIASTLRRLATDTHLFFAGKVMVALLIAIMPGLLYQQVNESVLLSLGIVAGAIAEPDDSLPGRLKNLLMTMLCFVIATTSVQLLYPYPWLFAAGLFASTVGFIMLGALGPRYATISFGSLLVAIYSMLGASHAPNLWFQPLWLCLGAMNYGIISLLALKYFPHKAVHEELAQIYFSLARYFAEKARFFPVSPGEEGTIRNNLAQLNIDCTRHMQLCLEMLRGRLQAGWDPHLERLLQLYLQAQELHERVVSSHVIYDRLPGSIPRGSLLDGFQEALKQLGMDCDRLGFAILTHQAYTPSHGLSWIIDAIEDQLAFSHLQRPYPPELHTSLRFLHRNLQAIFIQLQALGRLCGDYDQPVAALEQRQLVRAQRTQISELGEQILSMSPLFRHAIRMATCLVSGYGLLHLFHIQQGFWVLLTALFVCQNSYTATRRRIGQRIVGTLIGLLLGVPLLWFTPQTDGQLLGMLIAATLFFAQLRNNYSAAVTFITLYALTAFGLLGVNSSLLLLPRLTDTLLGATLSFLAILLLWPDWQYRSLPQRLAHSLAGTATYLGNVVTQLDETTASPAQELAYRIARRNAHLADSALASSWQNMLFEPKSKQKFIRLCSALTQRSHSIISYVSTLGAHRMLLRGTLTEYEHNLLNQVQQLMHGCAALLRGELAAPQIISLQDDASTSSEASQLIKQELHLIVTEANTLLRITWLLAPMQLSRRH